MFLVSFTKLVRVVILNVSIDSSISLHYCTSKTQSTKYETGCLRQTGQPNLNSAKREDYRTNRADRTTFDERYPLDATIYLLL